MVASSVEVSIGGAGEGAVKKNNINGTTPHAKNTSNAATEKKWEETANIFEYGSAANPVMAPIPVLVHPPTLHEEGETRVIPFDIDDFLDIETKCTSPNLMASFVRVLEGESIDTAANATSQAFYVIRGDGETSSEHGTVSWSTGDLFVVPVTKGSLTHSCSSAEMHGGAALYWVHDEPLMDYLGVMPNGKKFEPTLFKRERMLAEVQEIAHANAKKEGEPNRLGVLLGNKACEQTKTLTHVLWSLLNSIPAQSVQRPHRHNSVALDLAVSASPNVYTLMARRIGRASRVSRVCLHVSSRGVCTQTHTTSKLSKLLHMCIYLSLSLSFSPYSLRHVSHQLGEMKTKTRVQHTSSR